MIKQKTIRQIIEAILDESADENGEENVETGESYDIFGARSRLANEATIYYKTALICEKQGIDAAMKYYTGTHDEDEYLEFRGVK